MASAHDRIADNSPVFKTREGRLLHEYFQALQKRHNTPVPRRKDFQPRDAKTLLPHLFIAERIDDLLFVVRLFGTILSNRIGTNVTGKNILDFIDPQQRAEASKHITRLLLVPCASRAIHSEHYRDVTIPVEVTQYPFSDDAGQPRFIFGVSVEVDLQSLAIRGKHVGNIGTFSEIELLDIGAGT